MIDIKKIHPCIPYLNSLSAFPDHNIINLTGNGQSLLPSNIIQETINSVFTNPSYEKSDLNGHLGLREKISNYFEKEFTWKFDPISEITITAGAPQAISTAISTLIKEGDEAIIFEPSFFSYSQVVQANGGRPVYVPLQQPDFNIVWDDVQKVINTRTKLIIINTPHNPTGVTFNANDMERLSKIVNGTNIHILSDESFLNIVFDKYEHQSIARYPKLAERSIIVSSLGKWFSTDGWKIAFCAAPAKITADYRRLHNVLSYSVNNPFQAAFNQLLNKPNLYTEVKNTLQTKRDLLINKLKKSNFILNPSQGSYFQLLNYSKISNSKDIDFSKFLLDEHKLAVLPISYFYHDLTDQKYIRICFAQPNEVLEKAADILQKL